MKAVIPAAGQGTRLYPQTHTKPKPMVRVAGKPILGHILDGLVDSPIDEAVIVVGVMQELVIDYVTEEYPDELDIEFVEQEKTEGLGHCVYQTKPVFESGDSMCIILGDMLFESGYDDFLESHIALGDVDGSIGVKPVEDPTNYGIVDIEEGKVTRLVEKPDNPNSNLAISGIYFVEEPSELFAAIEYLIKNDLRGAGDEYQLTDALQQMLEKGAEFGTFEVKGWYDCGRPETLLDANEVLLDVVNTSTSYEGDNSVIIPPVDIGEQVEIDRSVVGPYVSIGDGASLTDCRIEGSILGRESALANVNFTRTIVGDDSAVREDPSELNVGDSSDIVL